MLRGFAKSRGVKDEAEAPSDDEFFADLAAEMASGRS
jgi:hypothetical protein